MSKLKSKAGKTAQNNSYKNGGRRARNKIRKLIRHLIDYPNDAQAEASLKNIEKGKAGVKGVRTWKWATKPPKRKDGEVFTYRKRIGS